MIEIKEICKTYTAGNTEVNALKGVSICFRDSEFVSILGPSGCGKTTLLNIIGGLDKYDSGDLVIDGVSTKEYSNRDWDTYRNHRIGFIFQSYNLIPHQNILQNVELALNIAGVGRAERTRRAKEALDKVGLSGIYSKKPNQLSGGQCQRVAIARALVTNPEILLADEPTGALDSETSVQIMDLIKEISKERLVIMVTHNPELAEKYSTRIVNLLDGEIINDSKPISKKELTKAAAPKDEEVVAENKKQKAKNRKSKLSFWSAFRLSAKNLISKIKRTIMVCLAGSIGIIGVASVLAVSTGITGYINNMQKDMLAGNPVTISESTLDLNGLMSLMNSAMTTDAVKEAVQDGYVNVDYLIDYLVKRGGDVSSLLVSNKLTDDYISFVEAMPVDYYASLDKDYSITMGNNIYTNFNFDEQEGEKISLTAAQQIYRSLLSRTEYKAYANYISMFVQEFEQAPSSVDFIKSQYDIISNPETSKIATEANEIMLVVSDDTDLSDLFLAQLGYYSQKEFLNLVDKATGADTHDPALDKGKFSYDELLGKTFTWYPNNTVYTKQEDFTAMTKPFVYNAYADEEWEGGIDLKITAILRIKEGHNYSAMDSGIYYTEALTKQVLKNSLTSEIVNYLIEKGEEKFTSTEYNGNKMGITYDYSYTIDGTTYNETAFVGSSSSGGMFSAMMGGGTQGAAIPTYYTLTIREIGGVEKPSSIYIYSTEFDKKDLVTDYLDQWNSDKDITVGDKVISKADREDVVYTDALSIVIKIMNELVNTITIALVAFTALSLLVSTVMIAIITYVSVIERIKEIGVIRSLGGRRSDVSNLFIAETFIIGLSSGVAGIVITYILTLIINAIVKPLIGTAIATLTAPIAFIMIAISVALTLISGVMPAALAAKKDPVKALRTE